jgi:hypothetical protein
MTKAEYAREKQQERLLEGIRALQSEEGWKAWMKSRSRFHSYSLRNTMLIACQRPEATRVAGFRTWDKQFNRRVVKGATAIWILAPSIRKAKTDDEEDRIFFRSVKVFDVAETEPIPDRPEIPIDPPRQRVPQSDNDLARNLHELIDAMRVDGWTVELEPQRDGRLGFCDSTAKKISIEAEASANAQFRILVHECAHAFAFGYEEMGRPTCEAVTDAAAWCVCDTFGLDISDDTIPYVAGWSEAAPEAIQRYATAIHEVATRIEGLAQLTPQSHEAADESAPAEPVPAP